MAMNPDIGFPALNAMLLIGAEAARYGASCESGMLALVTGCVMRHHYIWPGVQMVGELVIQPGDAALVDLEDGFRGDTADCQAIYIR